MPVVDPQTSQPQKSPEGRSAAGLKPTKRFVKRLAGRLNELGLSMSFWNPDGDALTAPSRGSNPDVTSGSEISFQGQFCRQMCGQKHLCLKAMGLLARKVCRNEGEGTLSAKRDPSPIATSPIGCCMLAVPVRQRRRVIGAVVACFPTPTTADSEEFARACGQARLDKKVMAGLCRQEAGHTGREAKCLYRVVNWAIRDEHANEVAKKELTALSANLANTYEELSLLYRISSSMKVTQDTAEFFEGLCGELVEGMQIQAAAVVLPPRLPSTENTVGGQAREHSRGSKGVHKSHESMIQVFSAGELPLTAEQLVQISRQHIAPRISSASLSPVGMIDNRFSEHSKHLGEGLEQVHTLVAAPLMVADYYYKESKSRRQNMAAGDLVSPKGWRAGILVGINKLDGEEAFKRDKSRLEPYFDSADLKLISSISSQAAVFLKNHYLYEDLQDLLMGVLHALTASIDAKDPYTCGHSHRVALVSRKLAQLSGFDQRRVERIYLAGLLHDIGKIGVPEAVLRKTGKLTANEYDSIKLHPEIGATILSGIRQMEDIVPAMLHHHERLDGRGYPHGLSAGEIPIEALIVGLADGFDAMTSFRTYRAALPLEAVVAEIRRCSGTQFDPHLVKLLLSLDLEDFLTRIRSTGTEAPSATCRV